MKQHKLKRNPRGGLLIPLSSIGAADRKRHPTGRFKSNEIRATLRLGSPDQATLRFEYIYPDRIED